MDARLSYETLKIETSPDGRGHDCFQYESLGRTYFSCNLDDDDPVAAAQAAQAGYTHGIHGGVIMLADFGSFRQAAIDEQEKLEEVLRWGRATEYFSLRKGFFVRAYVP